MLTLEEIGKKILNGVEVSDDELYNILKIVIKTGNKNKDLSDDCDKDKPKTKSDSDDSAKLEETKRSWTKMVDLWSKFSLLTTREIHIGRQMVFFLRLEISILVKNSLPWRELEFLLTFYLLRHQPGKLSSEEQVICDLTLNWNFLRQSIENFTESFLNVKTVASSRTSQTRLDYITNLRNTNYPNLDQLMKKFGNLRRCWSLMRIRELLDNLDSEAANKDSYFVYLCQITELFQNTIDSPHFPSEEDEHRLIDDFLFPNEFQTTVQPYRYIFGHMIELEVKKTGFENVIKLFEKMKPVINILIENEKRIIIMDFIKRILPLSMKDFENEIDVSNLRLLSSFKADRTRIEKHCENINKIIAIWNEAEVLYKEDMGFPLNEPLYLITTSSTSPDPPLEPRIFEYFREVLQNFRNAFELLNVGFVTRINPLLIKIANFKMAENDAERQIIFKNIRSTMKGFKISYKYIKPVRLHYRVSSVMLTVRNSYRDSKTKMAFCEKAKIVEDFFNFAEMEKVPELMHDFLQNYLPSAPDNITKRDRKTFRIVLAKYLNNDGNRKKMSDNYDDLINIYQSRKPTKGSNIEFLESCFGHGIEIMEFKSQSLKEIKNKSKHILDWIPIITGKWLRNYIIHNPQLLQLLPYNYEVLLKVNCDVLFEEEKPNFEIEKISNYEQWIDYIQTINPKTIQNCFDSKDLDPCINLIKFGSTIELKNYNCEQLSSKMNPNYIKYAMERGNKGIFDEVLTWNCIEDCLEESLTDKGYTAFLLACELGETDFVKVLIKKKCNIFAQTNFKYSCFHIAAQRDRKEVFNYLLDLKLCVNNSEMSIYNFLSSETKQGLKPQHIAVENGSLEVIKLIRSRIGDISKKITAKHQNQKPTIDWNEKIISLSDMHSFKFLDIEPTDCGNFRITTEKSTAGKLELQEEIEDKDTFWGVINIVSMYVDVFKFAIECGYIDILSEEMSDLFEDKLNIDCLYHLIRHHYGSEIFLKYYKDYQKKFGDFKVNDKGWTLLYTAVRYNSISMIEYFKKNLEPSEWRVKTSKGVTPVNMLFEMKRKVEVQKLISDKKLSRVFENIKDHTVDKTGRTLLHWIVLNRWEFCFNQLPQNELLSLIDDKDQCGETPLDYTKNVPDANIIEHLEKLQSLTINLQ